MIGQKKLRRKRKVDKRLYKCKGLFDWRVKRQEKKKEEKGKV